MSRILKFRAWDKELKTMHVIGEDSHDSWLVDEEGYFRYSNLQNGEGSGEYGVYELMQFTGLHDKNGKEIYEGDILGADDGYIGVIEYLLTKAQYVGKNVGDKFTHESFDTLYTDNGNFKTASVVGNIFENGDLLDD